MFKIKPRNLESDVQSTTSPGSAFQTLMTLSLKSFFVMLVKAKLHYTSWFGTGSEMVRSWFEAKIHYAI